MVVVVVRTQVIHTVMEEVLLEILAVIMQGHRHQLVVAVD